MHGRVAFPADVYATVVMQPREGTLDYPPPSPEYRAVAHAGSCRSPGRRSRTSALPDAVYLLGAKHPFKPVVDAGDGDRLRG
jgi:hypothetical protein